MWEKGWSILSPWKKRISKISEECLRRSLWNLFRKIPRNHEEPVPLIWTHLRSPNAEEFLYSTLFLLLVAGYLVCTHLLFVSRASSELQTELERIKSLTILSYMIELEKLMSKYPTYKYKQNSFGLKNLFLVAWGQFVYFLVEILEGGKSIGSEKNYFLSYLISILPNPTNRIAFLRNTRHLSRTSKEIYSLIIQIQIVGGDFLSDQWISDQIEYWSLLNVDWIDNKIGSCLSGSEWIEPVEKDRTTDGKEKQFMAHFYTLTTKKRIDQIILSLTHTHSDYFSKNDSGYQTIEQPGSIYLRSLVDIHKKYLMNYEFNRSCLAEKRIFLAHYQIITYLQTSRGTSRFPSRARPGPFSFRSTLSPSRNILVIGSKGLGRSCLVKYLATNSYFPFIMLFTDEFRDADFKAQRYRILDFDESELDRLEYASGLLGDVFGYGRFNEDDFDDDDFEDIGDIDADFDFDGELWRTMMGARTLYTSTKPTLEEVSPFDTAHQLKLVRLEFAKAMSHCIIWIPNIHDLSVNESNYLSRGLLENYFYGDCERGSTRNFLVIASTHIPKKLDPGLIAPNKFTTCIKMRRPLIPQRRKHFFTLSHTRGFHLEKKKFHTNGFGSITVDSRARDLVALTNEALSISLARKKSIIDTNTIRSVLYRQAWEFRYRRRSVRDHGIVFYQIGRVVAQNVLLSNCLSNCPIDPISIVLKKDFWEPQGDSYLSKWYFELGMSMKRLTILLYLLSCSAGPVAQDIWSTLRPDDDDPDAYRLAASYRLARNDSDLVHGLLEVEVALVGSSRTEKDCSQFDNDRVTLLLRSEPRNPLYMMQKGSCSIADRKFIYEKEGESWFEEKVESWFDEYDELGFVEEEREEEREEDPSHDIHMEKVKTDTIWAPRIWYPYNNLFDLSERTDELEFPYWAKSFLDRWPREAEPELDYFELFQTLLARAREEYSEEQDKGDEDEQNYSEFLGDEIMKSGIRDRFSKEKGFFRINQFIWSPPDPFLFLLQDPSSVFSRQEFFADEEMSDSELDSESELKSDSDSELKSDSELESESESESKSDYDLDTSGIPRDDPREIRERWFRWTQNNNKARFELLIDRQRHLRTIRTNSSLFNGSFRSNTPSESYRYLSNLFLSNGTLLDQMIKALLRKRCILPEEMKRVIRVSIIGEGFPIP